MYGAVLFDWGIVHESRFMGRVLDEWNGDLQEFVHTKLPRLIAIALISLFLIKVLRVVTRRMVHVAEQHGAGPMRVGEVKTLAGVVRATGLSVIGVIAVLQFLDAMGMNLAPLLTSAGIAGIAIGLAAQTIVKDMFNGILIIVEGQFNVGDTIKAAGVTGVVESITLRKTTLRDGIDGTLYVIPNSQIGTIGNLSSNYSLATIHVSVDYAADPDQVAALLKEIAAEVRSMEPFREVFKAEPQVLGVDSVKGSQLIFTVVFKTLPTQQYAPTREFQRRVRLALAARGILPGDPLRIYGSGVAAAPDVPEAVEPAGHDPTRLASAQENPLDAK